MRAAADNRIRAASTVETAVVMSVVLLSLMLVMFAGFYLHDLNILSGAVCESAQAGAEWERMDENRSVQAYFQDRIRGKLIFFPGALCTVETTGENVCVRASAASGRMRINVNAVAAVREPERMIRVLHQ